MARTRATRAAVASAAIVVVVFTLSRSAACAEGEMDIDAYCRHLGYARTTLVEQSAYGWRCTDTENVRVDEIDLVGLCAFQYAGQLPLPRFSNFDDPFSWRCYEDPTHLARTAERVPCNGNPKLCERSFDRVIFATTHNSHATYSNRFVLPNQPDGIANQLRAGIRALMLDIYYDPGWRYENGRNAIRLCHGDKGSACLGGYVDLRDGLREIREFLDANPREVVTLILEDWVPAAELPEVVREFEDSGLVRYAHTQRPGDPWPTLGQMIASEHRLVVLSSAEARDTDEKKAAPAWYHDEWGFAWESDYNINLREISPDHPCNPKPDPAFEERAHTTNSLFIMNHFVTPAEPGSAARINDVDLILGRVDRCASISHRAPTFVAVDFYNMGNVVEAVRRLNAR